jgi:hypothetical protein
LEELIHRRRERRLPIHQPTPVRARSDELFPDFLAPQMPAPTAVGQPPLLVPFTYQPVSRPPRSVSPTADLPTRVPTEPILPSMTTRPVTRFRPPFRQPPRSATRPSEPASTTEPRDEPGQTAAFLDQVRDLRRDRQPLGSDGFFQRVVVSPLSLSFDVSLMSSKPPDGVSVRPSTAPPESGDGPWYRDPPSVRNFIQCFEFR